MGSPIHGWFMENPVKMWMMTGGVPLFQESSIWTKRKQRLKKRFKQFQSLNYYELFDKYVVELLPWAKLGEMPVNGQCLSHGSKICLLRVSNLVVFYSYVEHYQPAQLIRVENLNCACRGIPLTMGMFNSGACFYFGCRGQDVQAVSLDRICSKHPQRIHGPC